MKNKIIKRILFVYLVLMCQILFSKDVYAGDILAKFVFDYDGVFFMQPVLQEVVMYNNQYMVKWQDIEDVDGYIIYRKVEDKEWKKIAKVEGSKKNWYFDDDIDVLKSYDYTVSAYRIKGEQMLISKRDQIGISYMLGPVITSLDEYKLKWEKCKKAQGYTIYYRDSEHDKWKKIKTVDKYRTSYSLGTMYEKERYYKVKAYYENEKNKIYSVGEENITYKNRSYKDTKILFEGNEILIGKKNGKNEISIASRVEQLTDAKIKIKEHKSKTVKDIIKSIDDYDGYFKGYDIICLALGNEDYMENVKIGKATDINKKSFIGQINYIIKKIRKQNSNAKIVLITPFYSGKYKKKENINCYVYENKKDYTLDDYAEAMRQIASYRQVYLYDTEKVGIVNVDNVGFMTTDMIHPTSLASGKIACTLVDYLVEYDCLK